MPADPNGVCGVATVGRRAGGRRTGSVPVVGDRITDDARAMYADDLASQTLGIEVTHAEPGRAVTTMTVRTDQCNGLGVCHGGLIFTLADTAMAFATNASGDQAFATNAEVDFVNAARPGDRLSAECVRIVDRGRTAVCDVTVRNQHDAIVAVFRGRTLARRAPSPPDA